VVLRRRILIVEARVGFKYSACQICVGQVALSLWCQHPLMIAPYSPQGHSVAPQPPSSDAGPHAVTAGRCSCPINRVTLLLNVAAVARAVQQWK
jgi:hypothetical protein